MLAISVLINGSVILFDDVIEVLHGSTTTASAELADAPQL
jgi:hypothetical protein